MILSTRRGVKAQRTSTAVFRISLLIRRLLQPFGKLFLTCYALSTESGLNRRISSSCGLHRRRRRRRRCRPKWLAKEARLACSNSVSVLENYSRTPFKPFLSFVPSKLCSAFGDRFLGLIQARIGSDIFGALRIISPGNPIGGLSAALDMQTIANED